MGQWSLPSTNSKPRRWVIIGLAAGAAAIAVGATVPLGRMADPSDVADVCLFLASPLARYVNGADVLVHGGGEKPAYMDAAEGTVRD